MEEPDHIPESPDEPASVIGPAQADTSRINATPANKELTLCDIMREFLPFLSPDSSPLSSSSLSAGRR
jgi:hypothetical protein